MDVIHQIEIDAPLGTVWSVTKDIESWPTWTPTVTRVERLSGEGLEPSAQYKIKQPMQRAKVWVVTEVEDARLFFWETGSRFIRLRAGHCLVKIDGGTRNVLSVSASGIVARLMWPILRPAIAYALKAENAGLKAACEARIGRSAGGQHEVANR